MKNLLYIILRAYTWLGLEFYFSRIEVIGKENIPKKGAVLFTSNHQNAFLDALLIDTHNGRKTHFLARAEVFNKPIFKWLLSLINMMPIYRMRDGWQNLNRNEEIFNACNKILANKESLLIFPEGNHGFERRLRPLSKGFTRIAFGAISKDEKIDLKIVPVGINYQSHQGFRSRVSIHYGPPIDVKPYFNPDEEHLASLKLRDDLFMKMNSLVGHIDTENYQEVYNKLIASETDFSNLNEVKKRISHWSDLAPESKKSEPFYFQVLRIISKINLIIPFLLWAAIKKQVKDPVMLGSIKFVVGISVFVFFLLLQSFLVYYLSHFMAAFGYLILSVLVFIYSRHPNYSADAEEL